MLAHSDEGSGPAVVLLHGLAGDRTRWAPVVRLMAGDLRCVSVDLPGHGESPSDGCDVVSAAAAVHELVEHLGLGAPVVVGHSLGGNVALLHAALFSTRGVVTVDNVPLHLPHFHDDLAPYLERLQGDDFVAAFHDWEREQFGHVPGVLRPRRDVVLSYWRSLLSRDAATATQEQLASALASVTAPTLLCLSAPLSPEDAALVARMPSAQVETYDGLGHFLHLVDPQRFAGRLRTWVQALPG